MSGRVVCLLLAAFGLLLLMTTCLLFALVSRQHGRRFSARVEQIVRPHAQARSTQPTSLISLATPSASRFSRYLALWLLYDMAKRDRYALPLPLVLLASATTGIAAYMIAHIIYRPLAWPVSPSVAILTCRSMWGWCDQRIKRVLFDQFPDALSMIVRAVRVGVPVSEAIGIVAKEASAPTAREFSRVAEQVAIGATLEESLRGMAERNSMPEYGFFAVTLSLQSQTGGGLTETLENLAETVRKRAAARERGGALASEAKMSMYILAALPPCVGGIMMVVNASYISVLFEKQAGERIVAFACLMWCMGMFSMRMLIRKSLS